MKWGTQIYFNRAWNVETRWGFPGRGGIFIIFHAWFGIKFRSHHLILEHRAGQTVGIRSEFRKVYGNGMAILLTFWAQHSWHTHQQIVWIIVGCREGGPPPPPFRSSGIYGNRDEDGIVIERTYGHDTHSVEVGRPLIKCSRTWLFITQIYVDFMTAQRRGEHLRLHWLLLGLRSISEAIYLICN